MEPAGDLQSVLRGVQKDLGKRLGQLSRAIQQVAAVGSKDVLPPDGGQAATTTANVVAQQDAALHQALQDAAERIRDFQRRAEHRAQELQLEAALAPIREQHAGEVAVLQGQLASAATERDTLLQQIAELEAENKVAAEEGTAWREHAAAAETQLGAALQQHEAEAAGLRQTLAAAQEREERLVFELATATSEATEQHTASQQALRQQRALAEQAAADLAAAQLVWQEERAGLEAAHQRHWEACAEEAEMFRVRCAATQQEACEQAARADAAQRQADDLQQQIQSLQSQLGEARQQGHQLTASLEQEQSAKAGLAERLAAAEDACVAGQRKVDGLQQQLAAAQNQLKQQAAKLEAAGQEHSQMAEHLQKELSDARAEHAATRCTLFTAKQAAAEHEHYKAAAEARMEELQQELASQKQQAGLLREQLRELQAKHLAAAQATAERQVAAAAIESQLRGQLADAQQAAAAAMQEVAKERLACQSQVQLLQQTHTEQLRAAQAAAAERLQKQEQEAADMLAVQEAALQQQLADAEAARQKESQHLQDQAQAAAAALEGFWAALSSQVAAKLRQLSENLCSGVRQVQLSQDNAVLPALTVAPAGISYQQARRQIDGSSEQPHAAALPHVMDVPAEMQEVHEGLSRLYSAALAVRSQHARALDQLESLGKQLQHTQQQAADDAKSWQQRLDRELRQLKVAWDLKCSERAAEVESVWRDRLAASEDHLRAELATITRTLEAAQHNRQQLEQQCSSLAAELLAAQQAAAAGLEAAAEQAAAQRAAARKEAAEAARHAVERQQRAEESLRHEMQGAMRRLGEQHAAALQSSAASHQRQLEEAKQLAEQAAAQHVQELKRVEEAWRLQWAGETKRLQELHGDELAAAAIRHRQEIAEQQQQHGAEAARLRDAIASLERAERQLLKTRAALEAKVVEQDRAASAAAQAAAAAADAARLAAQQAAAGAIAELQLQVSDLLGERDSLLGRVAELQDRLGREPRPADLAAIAALEEQVAALQQQLATAEQRHARLRQEVLLREEVYNKKFAAGGTAVAPSVGSAAASPSVLMDWMLKASPGQTGSTARTRGTKGSGSGRPGSTTLPALGGKGGRASR